MPTYWHIGFYAHPRLPELLIAGREGDYLAEFIRTYQQNREAFDKEDLDEYAHHIASPGGLRGMLGVYRAIAAEAQDLIQLTHTKLTVPVWAVGGDHSMGMGPFEQFHHLAETVTGGVIENCGHWVIDEQPGRVLEDLGEFLRQ